jgi:hypothetical protein
MLVALGFQTCCIADFQVGSAALRPAGLETRDTADLEVCATLSSCRTAVVPCHDGEDFFLRRGNGGQAGPDISCTGQNADSLERRLAVGFTVVMTRKAD